MKFIKTKIVEYLRENYNIENFLKLPKDSIEKLISRHNELDEYQHENAILALQNLQKALNNEEVILYRILDVSSKEDIDIEQLGNHFTLDYNIFYDDVTLFDIGIKKNKKLFVVKITSPIENIDMENTIEANINYPFEKEVFLKTLDNIDILNISPFKMQENKEQESNLNNNFKKWFGNSKVVYKGKPMEVYHGSLSKFEVFEGDIYFTDDYMIADGYGGGEYVYEVYLSIEKPLVIDANNKKWDEIETEDGIISTQGIVGTVDRSKYDGVIFTNVKDSWIDDVDYQDSGTVYVTFKPNQIKSVYNDGSWDLNNDNIYS